MTLLEEGKESIWSVLRGIWNILVSRLMLLDQTWPSSVYQQRPPQGG